MSNQMKVFEKFYLCEGFWMIWVLVFEIGFDDVLIKIYKIGICGIDIYIWNWDDWVFKMVLVLLIIGYEFVGEVVEIGCNVDDLEIGQCCFGEGYFIGKYLCQLWFGKFYFDLEMWGIGVNEQGVFVEYLWLLVFNVVLLLDEIDDEIGVIFDLLGNVVYMVLSFDLVGEDVLIIGVGLIGIMVVVVVCYVSVCNVVIIDINQVWLDFVVKVIDVLLVNVVREDLKGVEKNFGMKEGFDVGLEMFGSQVVFDQMVENLVMGGCIVLFGILFGKLLVDWFCIVFKVIIIKGVYGCEIFEIWYKMIVMLQNGLDVCGVIIY